MTSFFDLKTVLAEQNSYVQRKYTADENAQAAMEQRELQNAENAVEAQEGFKLNFTTKNSRFVDTWSCARRVFRCCC